MDHHTRYPYLAGLGANIRKARKDKQWSLVKLAALSNHEKANLSRLEAGRTNPSIMTLMTLSRALEVDIIVFF
ncbi:MAG: helix-turn-helix transcriptional regulator [Bacteroidetes bacterium]|nr:helix-turn-helix transcriptional regulator [Bacteroidota bacterium]